MRHGQKRLRRTVARVGVASVLACLLGASVSSVAAQEPPPPRPDVFRSSAVALVASALVDRDALLPVPEALRVIAVDATGTYESSNQAARASLLYPGNGVIQGPNLACGTFGSQFPPELSPIIEACTRFQYPLTVFADSLRPEAATDTAIAFGEPGGALSGSGGSARAVATPEASTASAELAALRLLGLPGLGPVQLPALLPGIPELDATVVEIEAATASSDQRIDASGALVVEAAATLDGVRLLGGLIEIGSVRSRSIVRDDGRGEQTQDSSLDVGGVTVAGVPARITEDGLVVGSPTGADGPLLERVAVVANQLLDVLGARITLLADETGTDATGVSFARSGGVLVEFGIDVQGLPSVPGPLGDIDPNGLFRGVIELGATGATGVAAFVDPVVGDAPEGSEPDSGLGPTGPALSGVPGGGRDVASPVRPGGSQPPGDGGRFAPESQEVSVVRLLEELYADRVRLVYLAFTLTALLACLGPRYVLDALRPRSRT